MAADYYNQSNTLTQNFNEIMEMRYNELPPQDQSACKILEPLSIIDSYFTKDETAFFIDFSSNDTDETVYLAEEYLNLAEEQRFIVGEEKYHFINERIKEYFKARLSKGKNIINVNLQGICKRNMPMIILIEENI